MKWIILFAGLILLQSCADKYTCIEAVTKCRLCSITPPELDTPKVDSPLAYMPAECIAYLSIKAEPEILQDPSDDILQNAVDLRSAYERNRDRLATLAAAYISCREALQSAR